MASIRFALAFAASSLLKSSGAEQCAFENCPVRSAGQVLLQRSEQLHHQQSTEHLVAQGGKYSDHQVQSEKQALNKTTGCGMGTSGTCVASAGWSTILSAMNFGPFFDSFVKVWDDVTPANGFIFCYGDRPGSWIVGNQYGSSSKFYDSYQGLTYLRNLFISSQDSEDWATVGAWLTPTCPSASDQTYNEVKVGFAYNGCGTGVNFMLSVNPDAFECYAEKIAPAISKVIGALPEFSFGISLDRKLSMFAELCHGDGDDIRVDTITLQAHWALSWTIRINLGEILGLSNTIGDVLAGDLQTQIAVAFDNNLASSLKKVAIGDITSTLPDLVGGIVSAMKISPALAGLALEQVGANTDVVNLIKGLSTGTLMLKATGYITLGLSGITDGILPDMSFTIGSVGMMLRTGNAKKSSDTDDADSHSPGLYMYFSADLGSFVTSIVNTIIGQVSGVLSSLGISTGSISLPSANMGMGLYINSNGVGFFAKVKIGGTTQSIQCTFKFSNSKLRCKANLKWAELFLQAGKYVLNQIADFAGDSAEEIAEFFTEDVGAAGAKFADSVVDRGKKVARRVKCKIQKLLGGNCGKSGGTPSHCGDGTEYTIKNSQDECLIVSPKCYTTSSSEGKLDFSRSECYPVWGSCTMFSSDYEEQMKVYWWFTKESYLCNEYMNNMYFANIADPDLNPLCLYIENWKLYFNATSNGGVKTPTRFSIAKKSTERFQIKTKINGDVCLQSDRGNSLGGGSYEVYVRGNDGGRRRRRCDKDAAKDFRLYQKLEPATGSNYEKENGDNQFNSGCY